MAVPMFPPDMAATRMRVISGALIASVLSIGVVMTMLALQGSVSVAEASPALLYSLGAAMALGMAAASLGVERAVLRNATAESLPQRQLTAVIIVMAMNEGAGILNGLFMLFTRNPLANWGLIAVSLGVMIARFPSRNRLDNMRLDLNRRGER